MAVNRTSVGSRLWVHPPYVGEPENVVTCPSERRTLRMARPATTYACAPTTTTPPVAAKLAAVPRPSTLAATPLPAVVVTAAGFTDTVLVAVAGWLEGRGAAPVSL